MRKKTFLRHKVDPKVIDKNAKDFADLSMGVKKDFCLSVWMKIISMSITARLIVGSMWRVRGIRS